MAVRNLAEVGENLQIIIKRLFANQNLLKLLYYTDKDPLSHPDLTQEQIATEVYEKLIKIIPRIGELEDSRSVVVVRAVRGSRSDNYEFRDLEIDIEVFVPITQWIIKSDNLRPYHILGEIQKSLDGKKINGLGQIRGGDFAINFITEEVTAFEMTYYITQYD